MSNLTACNKWREQLSKNTKKSWCFYFCCLLLSHLVFLFKHAWHFSDLGSLFCSSWNIDIVMIILLFLKFSQSSCNFIPLSLSQLHQLYPFYAKHKVLSVIYLYLSSKSSFLFSFHGQLPKGDTYLSTSNLQLQKGRNHQSPFHFKYEPIAWWQQLGFGHLFCISGLLCWYCLFYHFST